MPAKPTFAARAGHWSAHHRKTAIALWLVFVIGAVVAGQMAGLVASTGGDEVGESARAEQALERGFPRGGADESVIIQAPRGGQVTDARVRAAVADVVRGISAQPGVRDVQSPYGRAGDGQISGDGRSALVTFEIAGDEALAEERSAPVLAAVKEAARENPGVFVGQFGEASANAAISTALEDDFKKAETLSIPVTLLILLLAFGSLIAAGVPLLLGVTAVMAALGLINLFSHVVPMDESISSIVLLIGLAVGVDYSLFYLRRAREERRAGRSTLGAVEQASATSGQAVLVSGLTVIIAMAGMFLAGDRTFTALGLGSIIVVAVAVVGSLTFVPAVLAALGDKVERGRIPFVGKRLARREGHSRFWEAIVGWSLRRPWIATLAAGGVLVVLALPALGMQTALTGTDDLPRKLEVMRVYDRMQAAFPVAVTARDVRAPQVQAAIERLEERALATGRFMTPTEVTVSADGRVAQVILPMAGDGADETSTRALADLRETLIPATIGATDAARASVTGMTAATEDFNQLMQSRAPWVFVFVLTLAFLLLLVTFRSIVVPIKAIVLNLLSVAAAYGVLTWVFGQGHLEGLLGFESTGAVVTWLPMFLFVILFGLSMDYHVFILSRVREAVDRGRRTEDAVREGILSTASTVTSAAFVMVAVFAVFATLSQIDLKQMGVGLAVAIAIDATIVRAVLLPAVMKLLGERNWYLPAWLEWLPRLSWEGSTEPDTPAPAPAPRRARRAEPEP
ncbi:MAG: MMPL family transporter, partial [Solirubrobacteraceae bacterium]|nr:MMPL family transporter [Solirubrobacteraceae bacterium]